MTSQPRVIVSVGSATDPLPYVRAVEATGAVAQIMMPNGGQQSLPKDAAGVVFCGGAAVHPSRFGQELDPNIKKAVDEARDAMEWALMEQALGWGLPILGICRGFQFINVYLGGTLTQNLAAEGWQDDHRPNVARDVAAHNVIASGGALAGVFGSEAFAVNSIHRQGIKTLAPGLTATVRTLDGLIEGYESPERNIIAIQWHPEELTRSAQHRALFPSSLLNT